MFFKLHIHTNEGTQGRQIKLYLATHSYTFKHDPVYIYQSISCVIMH